MQHRRVHVVHLEFVLDGTIAELIRRTVGDARPNPAARHPDRITVRVVVATIAALRERRAAKLAGPNHERLLQQAARLEVAQEPCNRLVGGASVVAVVFLQPTVGVPAVVATDAWAGQLDEPHTFLHQPTGHQALHPKRASVLVLGLEPVQPTRGPGLAPDVYQLRHGGLHAVRHFIVGDGRLKFVHVAQPVEHTAVESVQQTQLGLLRAGPVFARPDVGQRRLAGLEHRRLVACRQEAVAKIVPAAGRNQAAIEHHETRQVVGLRAEAVAHPRAHARAALHAEAGVQEKIRAVVLGELRGHRPHHAQLVRHRADVRKNVTDREAALAVTPERPRRLERGSNIVELCRVDLRSERFAVLAVEQRLGVERVDLRHAAVHVEENDILRAGRVMRPAWDERRPGPAEGRVGQQAAQRHGAKPGGAAPQHLPPRERPWQVVMTAVVHGVDGEQ